MRLWPRRRPDPVAEALLAVAAAVNRLADAHERAAKIRVGWVRRKDQAPEPEPVLPAERDFREWFQSREFASEEEAGDVWGSWEIVTGKRQAPPDRLRRAREVLREHRAPMLGG